MADIIHLLPDSVANQIAAGEVVQRPSSVVKELVENAIDSGAENIQIILQDAGKTSIQVIDDGCGMSETDARMAFERHATSKINTATDLFAIRTMGFRGEALASIASVAEVELKTKLTDSELGTQLIIRGSELIKQEIISCSNGSNFIVKNLFYNVPARRKFLKSPATELRNIISEFQRITIAHPEVKFKLINNGSDVSILPKTNYRQRIVNLFGKHLNSKLVNIESDTYIAKIHGFTGNPKHAKKTYGEQFFFVNNRFMKHPYLHKAIMQAYDKLLPNDTIPSYFIFFEVNPDIIDVNIHPTKTEIKFQDESALFQLLNASVREALGKFNIIPSLDFDEDHSIEIPVLGQESEEVETPKVDFNPNYNPFNSEKSFNPFKSERTYNPFNNTREANENLEAARSSFESSMNTGAETEEWPMHEDFKGIDSVQKKESRSFQSAMNAEVENSEAPENTDEQDLQATLDGESANFESSLNNEQEEFQSSINGDTQSFESALNSGTTGFQSAMNGGNEDLESEINSVSGGSQSLIDSDPEDFSDWKEAEAMLKNSEKATNHASVINQPEEEGLYSEEKVKTETQYIQLKNRYIITPVRSGMMFIDQKRAHERILYEKFLESIENNKGVAQQTLFPETIELDAINASIVESISEDLSHLGFDIRPFGNNTFVIHATPSEITNCSPKQILDDLIDHYKSTKGSVKTVIQEELALSLAESSAIHYNKPLTNLEMSNLIDTLFSCSSPHYTADGKTIMTIMGLDEIEGRFK